MRLRAWVGCAVALGLAAVVGAAPSAPKTTEIGRGPTLVLVHSMGSSRVAWLPTAKKLMAGHRVVMVDLPGHGESALPDPFSLEAAAAALDQVLAAQKAESTVVVGQGLGGVLGLMALAAHPERASGLVLIDASLMPPREIPDQQRERMLQFVDANYDLFLRQMFAAMGRDSVQGVRIHAVAAQVPPATIKAYFAQLIGLDATKAIRSLKLPVLAVGTERVWPADRDSLAFVKQMGYADAPRLTLHRVPEAGFLIASDQPDTLAALLAGFTAQAIARR